jgi:hypothetical protein
MQCLVGGTFSSESFADTQSDAHKQINAFKATCDKGTLSYTITKLG